MERWLWFIFANCCFIGFLVSAFWWPHTVFEYHGGNLYQSRFPGPSRSIPPAGLSAVGSLSLAAGIASYGPRVIAVCSTAGERNGANPVSPPDCAVGTTPIPLDTGGRVSPVVSFPRRCLRMCVGCDAFCLRSVSPLVALSNNFKLMPDGCPRSGQKSGDYPPY